MKCNMCSGELEHYNFNGTFIWTCKECPNIQFEYYSNTDFVELGEFLKKERLNKKYNVMYNVGKAKYLVSYHDGVKKYHDGSDFYDIEIFSNKVKMNNFIKELESKGYKKRGCE